MVTRLSCGKQSRMTEAISFKWWLEPDFRLGTSLIYEYLNPCTFPRNPDDQEPAASAIFTVRYEMEVCS